MRYVEITARNYWWTDYDTKKLEYLKNRADNKFVKQWLDSTFRRHIINDEKSVDLVMPTPELLNNPKTPDWLKKSLEKNELVYYHASYIEIEHLIDYLNTLPARPIKMSVMQVKDHVKEWDNQKIKVRGEGKVKELYKTKKFKWVQLLDEKALDYESSEMDHCVGKGGYDKKIKSGMSKIYSLRTLDENIPHVTLEVDNNNTLVQCKGFGNLGFPTICNPLVISFLKKMKIIIKDWEHDLVRNGIFPLKNKLYTSTTIPKKLTKYPASVFMQLYHSGVKFTKPITIIDGNEVTLHLFSDIDITCNELSVTGNGKVTARQCYSMNVTNFTGTIEGDEYTNCDITNSMVKIINTMGTLNISNSKVNINCNRITTCDISNSTITGHIKSIHCHITDSKIPNLVFSHIGIQPNIINSKITKIDFKLPENASSEPIIMHKCVIKQITGDIDWILLRNTSAVIRNANITSLDCDNCDISVKKVNVKRVVGNIKKEVFKDLPCYNDIIFVEKK